MFSPPTPEAAPERTGSKKKKNPRLGLLGGICQLCDGSASRRSSRLLPDLNPALTKSCLLKPATRQLLFAFACLPLGSGYPRAASTAGLVPSPASWDTRNCSRGSRGHRAPCSGCCVCPASTLSSSLETGIIPQCGYGKGGRHPFDQVGQSPAAPLAFPEFHSPHPSPCVLSPDF